MKIPDYITITEVQNICKQLGLRDWTKLNHNPISEEEASKVLNALQFEDFIIPISIFQHGLEVELEHGIRYPDANVTNNHPILTGRIVLAHLKETLDYYHRLDVAELEGDLLKALKSKNPDKMIAIYQRLMNSKLELIKMENKSITNI